MKKYTSYSLLVLLVTVSVFVSCKQEEGKQLVNHWTLLETRNTLRDSIKMVLADETNRMKGDINTMKEGEQREQFMNQIKINEGLLHDNDSVMKIQVAESYLDIQEKGIYACNLLGAKESGYWKYDAAKNEFVTTPAGGAEGRLKVLQNTNAKLILGEDSTNCMIFIASDKKN